MKVWIDVNGTLVGNSHSTNSECLTALQDLLDMGLSVQVVSSQPQDPICEQQVEDKLIAMKRARQGDVWIDDEPMILKVALRSGCIVVPAECFVTFVELVATENKLVEIGEKS